MCSERYRVDQIEGQKTEVVRGNLGAMTVTTLVAVATVSAMIDAAVKRSMDEAVYGSTAIRR
jgi:hypothetical protein